MVEDKKKVAIGVGLGLIVTGGIIYAVTREKPPPAPPPGLANLYGRITDAVTGEPISAVAILNGYSAYTDPEGNYIFTELALGSYHTIFESGGYQTAEYDITLVEGNNELNIPLIPILPLATFILFIKNAPAGAYEWMATPDGYPTKSDYIQNSITLTCPVTCPITIWIESEPGQILFSQTVIGTFEDGGAYVFNCVTLKFEEYVEVEVPHFVSLSIPPSVRSGAEFTMESKWYLTGGMWEWWARMRIYGTPGVGWNDLQSATAANPIEGIHTLRSTAKAVYLRAYIERVPLPPGKYPIRALLMASRIKSGISPDEHFTFGDNPPTEITSPQPEWDFGVVGYLNVV